MALNNQIASLHREFKDTWYTYVELGKDDKNMEEQLQTIYIQLKKAAEMGTTVLCNDLIAHLTNYFERSRVTASGQCRVGIYVYIGDGKLANTSYGTGSETKKISNHAIFSEVLASSSCKAYLDNNIPNSVKVSTQNGSTKLIDCDLDPSRVVSYYALMKKITNSLYWARSRRDKCIKLDEDWYKCIKDNAGKDTFCKSHLSVPITFSGHLESLKLESVAALKRQENNKDGYENGNLGVLVVDYPEAHFFDKTDPKMSQYGNTDVNLMYFFADLLSMALLLQRDYLTSSSTVNSYQSHFPYTNGEAA